MPGLIGKKIGMTSVFVDDGQLVPVTVIQAGPCKVVNIKTLEKDGYESLTLGFGEKKEKHLNKAQIVNYKKNKLSPSAVIKEFKNFDVKSYKIGDELKAELFAVGENLRVSGISKGKGFQGVMRRHGFGGVGGTTHGQSDRLRAPGSIGASSYPSRVFKGTRMAGRTGNSKTTVKNLKIVKIDIEKNLVMVKGAVPGAINSIVELNK